MTRSRSRWYSPSGAGRRRLVVLAPAARGLGAGVGLEPGRSPRFPTSRLRPGAVASIDRARSQSGGDPAPRASARSSSGVERVVSTVRRRRRAAGSAGSPRAGLLVEPMSSTHPLGTSSSAGEPWAGPPASTQRSMRSTSTSCASSQPRRADISRRGQSPRGDRLAVQPDAVAEPRLDGVAEGVAEVEQRAPRRARARPPRPSCRLVARRSARWRGPAPPGSRARRASRCASIQAKNSASRMSPYLITSARPGAQLPVGQRGQRVDVGEHAGRLVEGADHVLAARVVDRGLAADRGVHLGEQRRRHLDEGDAALVAGRGEARDVAHHAAAERRHGAVPGEAGLEQRVEDRARGREGLVRLAVGQRSSSRTSRRLPSGRGERRQVQRRRPSRWSPSAPGCPRGAARAGRARPSSPPPTWIG